MDAELQKICDGIFAVMDKNLILSASTGESKVSNCKMKCDYYQYLTEFVTSVARSEAAEDARAALTEAAKVIEKVLVGTHPGRLGLADVPVPHVMEEIVEGVKHIPQERVQCYAAEQIVDAPIPQMNEEPVKHISQQRVQKNYTVEQLVDVTVPWIRRETGRVIQLIPQGRISDRVVKQSVDASVRRRKFQQFKLYREPSV